VLKECQGSSFKEDVLFAILATVFCQEGEIRTQQAFDQCLKNNKNRMVAVSNEIGKLIVDVLESVSIIKKQLQRPNIQKEVLTDVNGQLDLLIYSGFIRQLPFKQLKSFPRYLKAINCRLDKQKDETQKMQELNRYWKRYWSEVEQKSKKQVVVPELDKFRWDLEEFRVSLFAQQLKTAYPISSKRLEKTWNERI
jgi:ATP-dependent helicase HrpA